MTTLTREMLWERLNAAGLADGQIPQAGEARSPWFVRAMLGIAGWIGASFLLSFVGAVLAFLLKSAGASFVAGAGACAVAVFVFRAAPKNDFIAQFGLAVSLAGQAMMTFGAAQWIERSATGIALYIALQQALLFVLVPSFVHRFWSAWTAALAATYAMLDAGWFAFAPAIVTASFAWVALSEFRWAGRGEMVRAAMYGLAVAAVMNAMAYGELAGYLVHGGRRVFPLGEPGLWLARLASVGVLVATVAALLRREGLGFASGQGRVGLAGALILGAASIKAPGVGPAAAILVLGFANGDRVLRGMGVVALLGYLSHYYYSLHATLLEKSLLLMATGVALLAARLAMCHWWPAAPAAGKEVEHA